MEEGELRAGLLELLRRIAPDVDPAGLDPAAPLRDAVDLDSMDYLNFLVAIHERYGVEIPEADAGRLRSLGDVVAYVGPRLAG